MNLIEHTAFDDTTHKFSLPSRSW